jgi:hypothetical protein
MPIDVESLPKKRRRQTKQGETKPSSEPAQSEAATSETAPTAEKLARVSTVDPNAQSHAPARRGVRLISSIEVPLWTPLYEVGSYLAMAKVVVRALGDPPQEMEIAHLLSQMVPRAFLELTGRNIAKEADSKLKKFKADVADMAARLTDLKQRASSVAGLWDHRISAIYDILALDGGQTLPQEIDSLRLRLMRLHDAIQPIPPKRRKPERQIDEFLKVLRNIWKLLTDLEADVPRHHRDPDEFGGDFLDFAWAAVALARKFPNSDKLGLPVSKNALGKRLASKKRAKPPETRGK